MTENLADLQRYEEKSLFSLLSLIGQQGQSRQWRGQGNYEQEEAQLPA